MLAGAAVTTEQISGSRTLPCLLCLAWPGAGAALGVAGSSRRDSGNLGFTWGLPGSALPRPLLSGRWAAHVCMRPQ